MGSQQTRAMSDNDLSNMLSKTHHIFPNDICLVIFSYLNSEENFDFLIKSCSVVCRQWRMFIKNECGLKMKIDYNTPKGLKAKVSNGVLKWYYVSSIHLSCNYESKFSGNAINGICKGFNAHLLKQLILTKSEFNDSSIQIITETLPQLQVLKYQTRSITDKTLTLLSQSENMQNLKVLDFTSYYSFKITDEGIKELCNSPYLTKNLEELHLGTLVSNDGIFSIINSFKLKALNVKCDDSHNKAVMNRIANCENMSNLTYLNIHQVECGSPWLTSATSLGESPYIKNLTYLNLTKHALQSKPYILLSSDRLKHIRTLILDWCELGRDSVDTLLDTLSVIHLKELSLEGNGIGSEGFKTLIHSITLLNVTSLNVAHNRPAIGNIGCLAIGSALFLDQLTSLNISKNQIDETGIIGLTYGNMVKLKTLDISYNVMSDMGNDFLDNCMYLRGLDVNREGCIQEPTRPPKTHAMK